MKRIACVCLLLLMLVAVSAELSAREERKDRDRPYKEWSEDEFAGMKASLPALLRTDNILTVSQVDTYLIVNYDFEYMTLQGWSQVDNTAQRDTFFHVDDFAGLGGGDFGLLTAIQGAKSLWCGARPNSDEYICTWTTPPGYGNSWDQGFVTVPISFQNPLSLSYVGRFDSEPEYDRTYVEYDAGEGGWQELVYYEDIVIDTAVTHIIVTSLAATKLRFRFESDGAWSDQDGLWNSDGAAILDEISVSDGNGLIDYEDFEDEDVGSRDTGFWHSDEAGGFGIHSGPFSLGSMGDPWAAPVDEDPCNHNLGTQIGFFLNPPPWMVCIGICPTPFCEGGSGNEEPCQDEMIVSPVIDMTKYSSGRNNIQDTDIPPGELNALGGVRFYFTIYRDLPLANCVFYSWMVRNVIDGCPGPWRKRSCCYYGDDKAYRFSVNEISDLVDPNEPIQVALQIRDMCGQWYLSYCSCAEHTYAPWYDNVRIERYSTAGPQWSYRDLDLFQDNFPSDTDIESYVRADAANDLNPNDDPVIRPGDSIVVDCDSPIAGGLAEDANGPKIYMHVKCTYIGDPSSPKPSLFGPQLEGSYGGYLSDNGTWTIIQGEGARVGGSPVWGRYMFDLNDSLFTRGYMVEYYFSAEDQNGIVTLLPQHAQALPESHPFHGSSYFFEFTCLPALMSDVLYVDDFHGRGSRDGMVQNYFDRTIKDVFAPDGWFDRYDVNSPSSLQGNGLAGRAQLSHIANYSGIIWDSGDLREGTIGDGSDSSDKSNDCQMLIDWMDQLPGSSNGLWILGDNVAEDLNSLTSPQAQELMQTWCGVTLEHESYFELTGGILAAGIPVPLIHTIASPLYWNPMHPDSFYLDGGCPVINGFDVLEKTEDGDYLLRYPDYSGMSYCAGIGSRRFNSLFNEVNTLWFGFSFMYIRDAVEAMPLAPIVRNRIMESVIRYWMQGVGSPANDDITGGDVPPAWSLAQNFPNPFNPVTTIKYSVRSKGPVSLRIYTVAGQLVRVLVDEVKDPGTHKIDWDGRNDRGSKVTSGVYFYCIKAKDYRNTKKMVILR